MKRVVLFMAGLALLSTAAFGQKAVKDKKAQYVSLGPVAGFGHSWISGMPNQQFKPMGHLGIAAIYSRNEHWGFGGELTASHEGYSMTYIKAGTEYTASVDPTYLRLTPRAYYFFGDYKSTVRPKVFAGPSLAFKVQEDHYTENTMVFGDAPILISPAFEVFNTVDFGIDAGLGVNFKLMKSTWLNLDAAYYNGFIDATGLGNMNHNVRLNAGLMFGL